MSPLSASFASRLRQFPSLVNCCTLDWFSEWPEASYLSIERLSIISYVSIDAFSSFGYMSVKVTFISSTAILAPFSLSSPPFSLSTYLVSSTLF